MSIIFCLFVHIKLYFLVLPDHNSTSQIGIVHILRQQSMGRGLEYFIELNYVEQLFKSVK